MKQITLPVLIAGIATKVDGSIKIILETRELGADKAADLFGLRNSEAWAVLAASNIKEVNLPLERPDPAIGTKTPSQRMRAVLYRVWEQEHSDLDFDTYYKSKMEHIIEQLKERLA